MDKKSSGSAYGAAKWLFFILGLVVVAVVCLRKQPKKIAVISMPQKPAKCTANRFPDY